MAVYQLVQGDTKPQIQLTLTRGENNTVADLTDCTVYCHIRKIGSTTLTLTKTCVITDAPNGLAVVAWVEGDLNISAGLYEAEIEIEHATFTETVFDLLTLDVREQLG